MRLDPAKDALYEHGSRYFGANHWVGTSCGIVPTDTIVRPVLGLDWSCALVPQPDECGPKWRTARPRVTSCGQHRRYRWEPMLTVLIPCKNERHNIDACVESARLLGGEILVADSGSTDGTLEIVAGMPDCRLIERAFVNYADFKNWAIPQASEPWVFVLDADERITEPLADEFDALWPTAPQDVDAFWVARRTFFLGHEARFGPWWRDGVYRLFRRDVCRYAPCRVHESLQVAPGRCGRLRNQLLHYSINSYDEYFAKHVNYTRWSAADLWDRGQRSSMWRMLARPRFAFCGSIWFAADSSMAQSGCSSACCSRSL